MLLESEEYSGPDPDLTSAAERRRLDELHTYCVLDTFPDKLCDEVTSLAQSLFGVQISLVSLVDEHRQWFKSKIGLDFAETPRSDSFCAHAILGKGTMVVLDARDDPRFISNPLVTGPPFIRFYAGAPLVTPQKQVLGTLCVIDSRPRSAFSATEVTQLERLAAIVMERIENLRNRGYIDNVTSLPNRVRLMEELRVRSHDFGARLKPCAAVAVDICPRDYLFDMVKALGWDYVEAFLREASSTLQRVLAPLFLYRVTTTTFVYLDESDLPNHQQRIEDVHGKFTHLLEIHGIPHQLDVAIGVIPDVNGIAGSDVVRSLLTVIDVGRSEGVSPRSFEQTHAESQRYAFWILSALPIAFKTPGELTLHYQPKIRLLDGECVGVEALIRWHHPMLGNISPEVFISLAEKTAQIRQITAWVLRRAVEQAAEWLSRGITLPIAVNTSARDFESNDLQNLIAELLQQHEVPPSLIEIEFTESAMTCNPEGVRQRIEAIRKLGVKVAIDDFGAGFSNLSYLKTIPADTMKIDRSFISRLVDDSADQMIVPAIIHLAHNLGFNVVAEGVETARTARILQHLGCDYAQGYGIARPMAAAELEKWSAQLNMNRPRLRPA